MIEQGALDAIRAGRPGVHLSYRGRVYEATDLRAIGDALYVGVRHLNGEDGGIVPARSALALERTYEADEF